MQENILKLENPITIDGKQRSEFVCKPEEITIEQFDKIDALCASGRKPNEVVMAEFDNARYRYVAMMSIVAADPSIDIEDLRRIKGCRDIESLRAMGRNFTFGALEELSEANPSEEQSEATAGSSTQASATSKG